MAAQSHEAQSHFLAAKTNGPPAETSEFRASHHPVVSYVSADTAGNGAFEAKFSVPSGGLACFVTIEGAGILGEGVSVLADGLDIGFQAVRLPRGWLALGALPESPRWWTAINVGFKSPETVGEQHSLRVSTRRPVALTSMVDGAFLPARRANVRRPDMNRQREIAIMDAIDNALMNADVEEAVKLTVAALALGLDEVKNSHGAKVLKAAAENADFTASNDGLKLFIAMSS